MRIKPTNDFNSDFGPRGHFGGRNSGAHGSAGSRNKAMLFGGIGILWAGLFTIVAMRMLGGAQEPIAQAAEDKPVIVEKAVTQENVDVLVPVRDIQANAALQPEDFIRVSRPKFAVATSAVTSFDELRGGYARSIIPANLPLQRESISKEQATNQVIANIPDGFRAVSINVNQTTSVEGWARAGARVDVQWIGELRGQRVARKLVENAKVLSAERQVDPHAEAGAQAPTSVTLLVSDKDSQRIGLAQSAGSLVLLLRGSNDARGTSTDGTMTWSDLIGGPSGSSEKNVEGVVKVREANGTYKEYAIVDGAVMQRKE